MPVVSASAFTSAEAPELSTPCPLMITGRFASPISLAASCTAARVSSETGMAQGSGYLREFDFRLLQLHVPRHVDQHRPRPAVKRCEEGLPEYSRQVVGRHDQVGLLGEGGGDGADVAFLERLRAHHRPGDLAR